MDDPTTDPNNVITSTPGPLLLTFPSPQTPPIIAGLASRGSRVLCHLVVFMLVRKELSQVQEDEEDEETCGLTLTADRPLRLSSGMQQHFAPSGLCALYLLNIFAQIQVRLAGD